MKPKVVVLSGAPYMARAKGLLRSMINVPTDLKEFGQVMVTLMTLPEDAPRSIQADVAQPFIRKFTLPVKEGSDEDPGFDERIMFEALFYTANQFRVAWRQQLPDISWEGYRFSQWLNDDLQLERC